MLEFTEADIIAAFTQATAEAEPGAGMTLLELAEATGLSSYMVRTKMKRLVGSGAWEAVKVPRPGMTGVTMPMWAYRPKGRDNNEPTEGT